MSKQGLCSCGATLNIPKTECLSECTKCREVSVFLCHVINDVKDLMCIRCKTCKMLYSLITCPKCEGSSVIQDFMSGHTYMCVCGFVGTLITCNKCVALMCLPTRKNYEDTLINCKKCSSQFKFYICPSCKECMYLKSNQSQRDLPFCYNERCEKSRQKSYQKMANQKVEVYQNDRMSRRMQVFQLEANMVSANPYEQISNEKPSKGGNEKCSICLVNQCNMINTSCYHLSVCESCVSSLGGRCPICRTQGEYKKIFKS